MAVIASAAPERARVRPAGAAVAATGLAATGLGATGLGAIVVMTGVDPISIVRVHVLVVDLPFGFA